MSVFDQELARAVGKQLKNLANLEVATVTQVSPVTGDSIKAYLVLSNGHDYGCGPYACEGPGAIVHNPNEAVLKFLTDAMQLNVSTELNDHYDGLNYLKEDIYNDDRVQIDTEYHTCYPVYLKNLYARGSMIDQFGQHGRLSNFTDRCTVSMSEATSLSIPPLHEKTGIAAFCLVKKISNSRRLYFAMNNSSPAYTDTARLVLVNALLSDIPPSDPGWEYYRVQHEGGDIFVRYTPGVVIGYEDWRDFYQKHKYYFR